MEPTPSPTPTPEPTPSPTPTPTPSPTPSDVSWDQVREHVPAELKTEKMWDSVKDVPTLLKNYAEAQKYIGGAVKIPKDTDGQEAWDSFHKKLGRPEAAEGYKPALAELPVGMEWDAGFVKGALQVAHAAGLSPKQVQSWFDYQAKVANEQVRARNEQEREAVAKLKEEIGPGYEKELTYGQAALQQLGGDDVVSAVRNTGLGNNPGFVKMMIKIGRQLAEDSIIDVKATKEAEVDAKAKVDAAMNDPKSAYRDPRHPGHAAAVQEMARFFSMLYPGGEIRPDGVSA